MHPDTSPSQRSAPPVPRVDVRDIMRGGHEVRIAHDGVEYRLRITANGKLILTK